MSKLQEKYKTEVVKKLHDSGKYKNPMQMPRLLKVVVNMSVSAVADKDALKTVAEELMKITGQKPVITKAKKSIANFKLREGMQIGAKVTLRGKMMFPFRSMAKFRIQYRGGLSFFFVGREVILTSSKKDFDPELCRPTYPAE